jgi:hypothetical protein
MRSSAPLSMSGCIRCRLLSCWPANAGPRPRRLAVRLLRHALEQKHGARGRFVAAPMSNGLRPTASVVSMSGFIPPLHSRAAR